MDFSALEKSIGYTFKDKNLLKNLKKIKKITYFPLPFLVFAFII